MLPFITLSIITLIFISLAMIWNKFAPLVLIAFIPFQFYASLGYSISINLLEIGITIIFILWLIRKLHSGSLKIPRTNLLFWVILYGGINVTLFVTGPADPESWKMILRGILYVLLYIVFLSQIKSWRHIWKALSLILLFSIPSAVFQYYLFFTFPTDDVAYLSFMQKLARVGIMPPSIIQRDIMPWLSLYPTNRPGANFDFGGGAYTIYLVPVILLAISLAWTFNSKLNRIVLWALATFLVGALLFTYSRTGMIAFLGSFLLMLWYSRRRKFAIFLIAIIILLLLYAPNSSNYMLRRFASQAQDAYPISAKSVYALRSIEIAFSNPFNLIIGGGMSTFNKEIGGVLPHNGFLADLQAKGIFSFVVSLGLFYFAFREARFLFRKLEGHQKAIALWIMGGIGSYFLQMLATTPLQETQAALMFWVMLGLSGAIHRMQVQKTESTLQSYSYEKQPTMA